MNVSFECLPAKVAKVENKLKQYVSVDRINTHWENVCIDFIQSNIQMKQLCKQSQAYNSTIMVWFRMRKLLISHEDIYITIHWVMSTEVFHFELLHLGDWFLR